VVTAGDCRRCIVRAALGLIRERIGRVRCAATIGRIFTFELLRAASPDDEGSLLACVEEAERAGLIFPVAERLEFSHELIRQALIGGLSAARREKFHLEVAEAIERICRVASESGSAESLDDWVADLAHHYAGGGDAGKAAQYCLRAVWRFANLGSNAEAIAQFERGLELLQKLPEDDRRAKLEMRLVESIFPTQGDTRGFASNESEQLATRAMALSGRLGLSWKERWGARYGVLFVHLTRPDLHFDLVGNEPRRAELHEMASTGDAHRTRGGDTDPVCRGASADGRRAGRHPARPPRPRGRPIRGDPLPLAYRGERHAAG